MVDHNNDKMGKMDKHTDKKKIVLVYTLYNSLYNTIYNTLSNHSYQSIDRLSPAFYFLSRFYHHSGSGDSRKDNFHLYVRLGYEGDPRDSGTIPVWLRILLRDPVLGKDDPLPFFDKDPDDPDDQIFYLFLSDRLLGPFLPMHDRMDVPELLGHRSFVDDPERWITSYFRNPFIVKNVPVVIEGRRGEGGILAMGVSGNYLRLHRITNVEEVFQNPGLRWKIPDDIAESIFVFQHDDEDENAPVFLRKRSLCPVQFIFLGVHLIDNTGSCRVAEKIISTLRDKNVIVVPFVLKCDLVITEGNKDVEKTIRRWWREFPNLVPIEDVNELKSLLGFLWQQDTLCRDGFSSSLTNILLQRYTLILNTMVGYEKFRGILKENYFGRKILIVHESWKKELQDLRNEFSRYLDDVVFVSQATRGLLFSHDKKPENGFRSSVLYNCSLLEDSIFDKKRDVTLNSTNKVRFLIAGSIEPRKSQLKFLQKVWVPFLQTMNRIRKEKPSVPTIELVMIGYNRLFNKEERRAFESICETYPEEIIYKGPLEDPTEEFLTCDVCLSTSVEESLPLNILDAMCASKPVVAADTFGIEELIVDEETGLIIDSGSGSSYRCDDDDDESSIEEKVGNDSPYPIPKPSYYNNSRFLTDFVMALDRVVQNDRMREEMGRKARERYEEYFSSGRFTKGYKLLMEGPTFLLHVHQNDPFQSIGLGNRLKSMVSGMIILESMGKPKEGIVVGYEKDHSDMRKLFTSKIVFREKRKGGEKFTIDWLSQFSSHPWYTWRWVVTKQDEVDSYEDMLAMMNGDVLYPFEKDEIERLKKFHKTSSYDDETGGGGSSVIDLLDSNVMSSSSSASSATHPFYKGVSLEAMVDFMYEKTPKNIRERIVRVVNTGLRKNIHPRLEETKRRVLEFLEKRALEGQQNTMKGIDLYEGGPSSKNILRFRHPIGSKTRLDRRSLLGFGCGDNTTVEQQPQRKQKIYHISVALRTWESDRYVERFEDEPGKPLRRFMIHDYLRKVRDIISEIDKKHPDQGSYVVYVLISSDNSMMETVFAQMVSKLHDVFPQLIRTQILEDDILSECYEDVVHQGIGKGIDKISTKNITNDESSILKILLLADQADYLVGDTISTFTELVWYFGETRSTTHLVGPYFFDPMIIKTK